MQTISHTVFRLKENCLTSVQDILAIEEPLEISILYYNQDIPVVKNISITMRTPGNDIWLAIGFLYTEGIVSSPESIENIIQKSENEVLVSLKKEYSFDLSGLERHFYTSSSCGVCGKTSVEAIRTLKKDYRSDTHFILKKEIITRLNDTVRESQSVFEATGGLHASALFTPEGKLEALAEDVGRHNALDKLIGRQFLQKDLPLKDKVLFLSGRASFELIQKAAMAEIPVICALGAPSSLAVALAEKANMTLVGFVKPHSFNIYCGKERIE
ncbi:MAG: formate dehydrogenase accessory sulfurtransferase FdhD [Bacteroidia bacterium]|nr:formate dehydrogenase accessory sulfurtransferase FdhD [Bacteroidia bacterium]